MTRKSTGSLFYGKWENQHGSKIDLRVAPDGTVSGRFESGVGLAERGETFALSGFATDDLISFVVDFSRLGSLTSWSGHFADGSIQALWHMTLGAAIAPGTQSAWKGTWSGFDTFRREPMRTGRPVGGVPSHPVAWPNGKAELKGLVGDAPPRTGER